MAQDKQNSPLKRTDSFTFLVIVVVVIVGIIAIFALGIFDVGRIKRQPTLPAASPVSDQQIRDLESLSTSDEIPSIEADLNFTNIDNLDQGLDEAAQDVGNL